MRGRPRKHDRPLPPYCYQRGAAIYYRARGGSPVRIGHVEDPDYRVWREYEKASKYRETGGRPTLRWLLEKYQSSAAFTDKAAATKKKYAQAIAAVCTKQVQGGGTFGEVLLSDISSGVFRRYMDSMSDRPVAANRQLAVIKVAFSWALERDYVASNPAKPVKKFPEKPRDRYITDAEYQAVFDIAPPNVQAGMELAYLCRLRKCEVIALTERDITEEGVNVDRVKGSKGQIIGWSPRLRAAINLARSVGHIGCIQIITTLRGKPMSLEGFDTAWTRTIKRAKDTGVLKQGFTFHDIKAKGVSDFDGDRRKAAGHRTESAAAIYDRRKEVVPSTR